MLPVFNHIISVLNKSLMTSISLKISLLKKDFGECMTTVQLAWILTYTYTYTVPIHITNCRFDALFTVYSTSSFKIFKNLT